MHEEELIWHLEEPNLWGTIGDRLYRYDDYGDVLYFL